MPKSKVNRKATKKDVRKIDRAVRKAVHKGVPEELVEVTVEQALAPNEKPVHSEHKAKAGKNKKESLLAWALDE
jgi:hypothetical protein